MIKSKRMVHKKAKLQTSYTVVSNNKCAQFTNIENLFIYSQSHTHIHTITKALDIELLQKVRMENVLPFQIRKMFDKADKDGDGKLTKDEWFNVLNSSGCETSM